MPDETHADRTEKLLEDLGRALEFPPTPDLAAAVEERLRGEDAPSAPRSLPGPVGVFARRPAYVAAAIVLALGLFFSFSSGARRAIADWLGVSGVRIEVDPGASPPAAESPPQDLGLGERTNLAEARRRAGFDVAVPADGPLAEPDEVYLLGDGTGGRVSFVYYPGGTIPPSEVTGTGAILTQFEATVDAGSISKTAGSGTTVRALEIGGRPAYWIEGSPHTVEFLDAEGRLVPFTTRLGGNVLLWERGTVTFRLESEMDLNTALGMARSIP